MIDFRALVIAAALCAPAAAAETLLFEQFSGASGVDWTIAEARRGPSGSISLRDSFHVSRLGAGGSGQAVSAATTLDQVITGPLTIMFEANPILRSVRNGCGDRCMEFPVIVRLEVVGADGQVHYVDYGVNYGPDVRDVDFRNRRDILVHGRPVSRPRGEFSAVRHVLQDTVPDAVLLRSVQLLGRGWDFEGMLDNLSLTMAPAETGARARDAFEALGLVLDLAGQADGAAALSIVGGAAEISVAVQEGDIAGARNRLNELLLGLVVGGPTILAPFVDVRIEDNGEAFVVLDLPLPLLFHWLSRVDPRFADPNQKL